MKKKLLAIFCTLVILWAGMFATDLICSNALREPVFARSSGVAADDGGSAVYIGVGYTVQVDRFLDAQGQSRIQSVAMRLFGRTVAGGINCY